MAPRKQVYGKRSAHVYSNFTGFTSPVKPRKQIQEITVAEVAEELGRLQVHDVTSTKEETSTLSPISKPLSNRDANAAVKPSKSSRSSKAKDTKERTSAEVTKKTEIQSSPTVETVVLDLNDRGTKSIESGTIPRESVAKVDNHSNTGSVTSQSSEISSASDSGILAIDDGEAQKTLLQVSNIFTQHASSLLALSSQPLGSFASWSDQLSSHFSTTKIAEASFGEVYRLSLLRPHPTLGRADESVLKIIALKPPKAARRKLTKAAKKRIEMMSDPEDVASEVRLMQRMTTIPGYTMFRECSILQGRPGDSFVSAWHDWNEVQKGKGKDMSFFPDPGKKSSYTEDQLWAVVEMQDAGTDLENVEIRDIWSTWDVFWGVVLALGKGEDAVGFEHRDLHLGNVCVSKRNNMLRDGTGYDLTQIDPTKKLGFTGIETTLIDYTISRAQITPGSGQGDEDVAFLDLENDLSIFEGDANEEYQYEIYRYMRAAMYLDDPMADLYDRWDEAENSGRTWRGYHPQTNLVWLHFILHQLLEKMEWPSNTDRHLSDRATRSTLEKAAQLEGALLRLQTLLDPCELSRSGLRSASDIVQLAMREEWLDEQDVKGSAPCTSTKKVMKRKDRVIDSQRKRNVQ